MPSISIDGEGEGSGTFSNPSKPKRDSISILFKLLSTTGLFVGAGATVSLILLFISRFLVSGYFIPVKVLEKAS